MRRVQITAVMLTASEVLNVIVPAQAGDSDGDTEEGGTEPGHDAPRHLSAAGGTHLLPGPPLSRPPRLLPGLRQRAGQPPPAAARPPGAAGRLHCLSCLSRRV